MPTLKEVFGVKPVYWETAKEGRETLTNVLLNEGSLEFEPKNKKHGYYLSQIMALPRIVNDFNEMRKSPYTDKFKHSYINCHASQLGEGAKDLVENMSLLKEIYDVEYKENNPNTPDSSMADKYANRIGRFMGTKYPDGDCDEMLGKYIKKYK